MMAGLQNAIRLQALRAMSDLAILKIGMQHRPGLLHLPRRAAA